MRATPLIRTGIATCLTATLSVLAAAPAPSYAAALSMTLNSASGPSGGGNALLPTVNPAGTLPFPAGTVPAVQFQFNAAGATACRTTAQPVTQMDGTASALTDGVLDAPSAAAYESAATANEPWSSAVSPVAVVATLCWAVACAASRPARRFSESRRLSP